MTNRQSIWALYFLQFLPLLIYPPETLMAALPIIAIVVAIYVLLTYALIRGRTWALSLSIFLQGFNVIVRLMMLFPHATRPANAGGGFDLPYIFFNLLAIAISVWVLLRLDKPDIRSTMVT
jgi:hypothetical protein